jgi:hypothetical protein
MKMTVVFGRDILRDLKTAKFSKQNPFGVVVEYLTPMSHYPDRVLWTLSV